MLKELNEKGIGKYINLEKWGLSTFELKILAILAMFIDHFSIIFLENNNNTLYLIYCAIGRICFPIICFVLVEGFFHTKRQNETWNYFRHIRVIIRGSL